MTGRRGKAVVSALLCAALTAAGCGLGPGADVGDVGLTVTREFGAEPMLEASVAANESDTVMRLLEGEAEVETRYGGGFVHAIDGVAEGSRGGDPYDWFFYVDGVEWPVGAAETDLKGGEQVWWDYRNWGATNYVPAVVGSWPAPFSHGIGGVRNPVVVECEGGGEACDEARAALEREGVKVTGHSDSEDALVVLVGPWAQVRRHPIARPIEAGPAESGVFADFQPGVGAYELLAMDEAGKVARDLGPDAGLVAATSLYGGLPVWVVTGGSAGGVRAAAESLDAEHLSDHYAVAIKDGEAIPLPLEDR